MCQETGGEEHQSGLPEGDGARWGGGGMNGFAAGRSQRPCGEPEEVQPFVMTADMMNQLMKENPNNMTHALRTWMTRGAEKAK